MTTTKLIEVTPLAASKLGEVLRDQGGEGSLLRIMVMPGGHGGLQYMLGVEKEPAENDVVIEAENVRVVVDPDSVALVEGSEIDYVEGLMRSGFVISNPNAAGGCGCGGGGGGGGGCGCGGGGGGGGGGGCGCGGGGGGRRWRWLWLRGWRWRWRKLRLWRRRLRRSLRTTRPKALQTGRARLALFHLLPCTIRPRPDHLVTADR